MNVKKLIITAALVLGYSASFNSLAEDKKEKKPLDAKTKERVVQVLESNEKLHNAFFNYEEGKVEKAAQKTISAIEEIENKEIKKLLTFSKGKLGEIKASNEREENNQNYHLVSMALIHIVNTYDLGEKYSGFSCPMVQKKWVQNTKKMPKVHNPYDPAMPHCGGQE